MRNSNQIVACLLLFLGFSQWTFRPATAAEAEDSSWTALIDGTDFDAWDPDSTSPPAEWGLKDGVLSSRKCSGGWLKTREMYENFELRLEFRLSASANSGVFLRADGETPHLNGLEVQLIDDSNLGEDDNHKACGALMLESGPRQRASKKAGKWQSLYIKCEGPKVTVKLNGKPVIDEDLSMNTDREAAHPGRNSSKGHIGLQNRGEERVDFRKIEVRELE